MKKLFLVDAYALIYRCYYAFLGRPMRNSEGVNTSAIFGFTKFMRDIIKRENPHYLGVAFDPKGGTFRHEMYPLYKANRTETPEDIHASVPYIKQILDAMRIPVLEVAGYEADDVIGTLSGKAEKAGFEVFMVTPDKDYGQLVTPTVHIYKQGKSGEGFEIVGMDKIRDHYGIENPRLIIDILALWGDSSDNIPGVMGIGEKGAIKLVNQFGTVEQILENTDKLAGKQRENIIASQEQLKLSKILATIDMNVPIEFEPEKLVMESADCDSLREIYRQLGFSSFIKEMDMSNGSPFSASYNSQGQAESNSAAPQQAPQTQLAKVAAERSRQKTAAALRGQGSLFDMNMDAVVSQSAVIGGDAEPVIEFTAQQHFNLDQDQSDDNYATALTTEHTYHVIRSTEQLSALVEQLSRSSEICFDTETTGFDIFNDSIVGISFAVTPFEAYYIPCNRDNIAQYGAIIKPIMENERIAKIGQNIKFDIMVLRNIGIEVRGFKYDTMILHYLLDPESRHNMNYLARTFLGYSPIEIESLIGRGAKQITMDMVSVDKVAEYAAEDADVTLRLKDVLWTRVVGEGLAQLYGDIEEPLIDVLAEIEMTGVRIDKDILMSSARELHNEMAVIEAQIREMADDQALNVNSSRQLGETLFAKLRIDPKPKMTKTKQFRTDEEYLQGLSGKHPIIGLILEYRGIKKLLSTYIEALPELINPTTGRVHASFNQAVTATGRLSSSNPNLQNIPVRDERGREIRKAFIPTDSDHLILSADYSQVELRLMAHLSNDAALISAFNMGEDIHTATASHLFKVSLEQVTPDQRRKAKTANFGIIYGISAFGLSQRLNIGRTEAKEIIDGYFDTYPAVKQYMEKVVDQAREDGYVSTIFGRKRFLNDIKSANSIARGLAERNAINAPIQGSAADIMKIAMNSVHRKFKELGLRSRVILQVHDELVIDMYKPEQEQVSRIVVESMEGAAALKVALITEYGVGENWLQAH